MNSSQLSDVLLKDFGLRIEPEMSYYILGQLNKAVDSIPVMGGNARTGQPMRMHIPAGLLIAGELPARTIGTTAV